MLWMILVATIGRRRDKFAKLLDGLLPQTDSYGGEVQVRALWNNGERPLSHVRQRLVEQAVDERAAYLSFVDDDDMPAGFYVDEVVAAISRYAGTAASFTLGGPLFPDYVGWRMQHYADGVPSKPTYHSLAHGRWHDDDAGYYRDVSHLNPMRTSIAATVDLRHTEPPEDVSWVDQLRGRLATEVVIDPDKVMYHYYATGDSTWMPGRVTDEGHEQLTVEHPNFAYVSWKD